MKNNVIILIISLVLGVYLVGADYTAEEFLNKSNCTLISKYDGGIQTHIKGTTNFNFNVTHGKGYYMYCPDEEYIIISDLPVSFTMPLTTGWNLIGSAPDTINYASELCGNITRCIAVAAYDNVFNVYTTGGANNFTVAPDKGYFVYVTENSNWTIII